MPFTPFHAGVAVFAYSIDRRLDFIGLMVGSVVADIEPFMVILLNVGSYPLHGYLHTFIGAAALAFVLAAVFKNLKDASFKLLLISFLIGTLSHVMLDSFLYEDIEPFFPLKSNPLLAGASAVLPVYGFCVFSFFLGSALLLLRGENPFKVSRTAR